MLEGGCRYAVMSLSEGVAIGVAVFALLFSAWQGHTMRRHNRLSLRPYLFFDTIMIGGQDGGLRLTNGGTGPAIAETFHVWLDDMEPSSRSDPGNDGWNAIRAQLEIPFTSSAQWLEPNQIVQPGETIFVMHRADNHRSEANDFAFDNAVKRLAIEVTYKSLYGEQFAVQWPLGKGLQLGTWRTST